VNPHANRDLPNILQDIIAEMVVMHDDSIQITVTDRYASVFDRDPTYQTTVDYPEAAAPALYRGRPLSVEYPLATPEEFACLSPIEDQLAEENTASEFNEDAQFDQIVLDMVPLALDAEQVSVSDFRMKEKYVRALLIKNARCFDSNSSLTEHLYANPALASRIGFESIPDQSTFWKHNNDRDQGLLSSVVSRVVHGAFRNGIHVPPQTKNAYNLGVTSKVTTNTITQNVENKLLVNWVDEILDAIVDPLTFGRAANSSYEINEIIGSTALAALINGPYSAPIFGSWFFDDTTIIGDHLYDLIKSLDKEDIDRIFNEIRANIVNYSSKIGFFDERKNIGLDTTWVTWTGGDGIRTINNPERCHSGEGWCFAALGLTSSGSRFTLGIDLVQNKTSTVNIFRRQLREAIKSGIDIGRIHADREFYSKSAVYMCRAIAGDNYAIRVKLDSDGDPPETVKSMDLSPGEAEIEPDMDFAGITPKVNVCGQRVPKNSKKDIEYMGFLTDLTEDDVQPSSLYQTYNKRWSIESYFRQLKHEMAPQTKSPSPLVRLFLFKLGTVFHNVHVLINNARSPTYGYCLDTQYYQVLTAIAMSTLDVDISLPLTDTHD